MKKHRLLTGADLLVHERIALIRGGGISIRGQVVDRGDLKKGHTINSTGIKVKRVNDPEAYFRYELVAGAWTMNVRFVLGLWLEELQ